jgi:hypothetical protein
MLLPYPSYFTMQGIADRLISKLLYEISASHKYEKHYNYSSESFVTVVGKARKDLFY